MIKYLKKVSITLILGLCFLNNAFAQKQPYEIIVDKDGFSSFDGHDYTNITIFLNNNTDETLYFNGTDCYNTFFSLTPNSYFHLADGICKDVNYSKMALPPHRSQKMELYLQTDKQPDRNVLLNFKLDFNKLIFKNNPKQNLGSTNVQSMDSILLTYNSNYQQYYSYNDFEKESKKKSRILPNKDIYLLTDNDRKLYTLSVNEGMIAKSHDTLVTRFTKSKSELGKIINVPIVIHNNSDDTLKFYSMSCSWSDFYGTNSKDINISAWRCEKNVPEIVEIKPHGVYKQYLPIIYNSKLRKGEKYKISLSLNKCSNTNNSLWGFDIEEYTRFNKIWSNEITIKE